MLPGAWDGISIPSATAGILYDREGIRLQLKAQESSPGGPPIAWSFSNEYFAMKCESLIGQSGCRPCFTAAAGLTFRERNWQSLAAETGEALD